MVLDVAVVADALEQLQILVTNGGKPVDIVARHDQPFLGAVFAEHHIVLAIKLYAALEDEPEAVHAGMKMQIVVALAIFDDLHQSTHRRCRLTLRYACEMFRGIRRSTSS